MYGKRTNPDVERLNTELQTRYGVLIGNKALGEILHLKSPTAVSNWVHAHELMAAGRRGYYYSRDVARAIVQNGGVV